VHENFYDIVAGIIAKKPLKAFTINRVTVPKTKQGNVEYTTLDLDIIYKLSGEAHPGHDCFVMKREIFEQINMGNIFLGYPPVANLLTIQTVSLAKPYRRFKSLELNATFHLGQDKSWKESTDKNLNYDKINFANAFDLRDVWSTHCKFSNNTIRKRNKKWTQYVGHNLFCHKLAHKFEKFGFADLPTVEPKTAYAKNMLKLPRNST